MTHADRPPLTFEDFELDAANARLTRRGAPVQIPPRAFDVLCVLAQAGGKLVTKDALLDAVWGHRHITESTLKTTIGQLRAALADRAEQPRYIETVPRRGFRFAAAVTLRTSSAAAPIAAHPPALMIGRESALARLNDAWRDAQNGRPRLVWIAGDAGIGKTTLIDAFLGSARPDAAVGQCAEQYGAGEPYLPILDALGSLTRRSPELTSVMRATAPMWLVQFPWLTSEAERSVLQRELAGANPQRMRREFLEMMERFTAQQPLALVVEDLHWSDEATLRLMEQFVRRRSSIRLLWIASVRLAQVIADEHPLAKMRQELRLHGLCEEIALEPFTETELAGYLASRTGAASASAPFVRQLHRHTDGLPLFVANVVDAMLADEGSTTFEDGSELAHAAQVPKNLAGAVELQFSKLAHEDQRLLATAGVYGLEFRASVVADALGLSTAETIARCDALVQRQYWLRHLATTALSDGAIDSQYAFRHVLYRHVMYERMAPAERAERHRRLAGAMQRGRARGAAIAITEIATHYEAGLLIPQALRCYIDAARHAINQFASDEALRLTTHALTLISQLPPAQREESELVLATNRAIVSSQLFGMAAPQTLEAVEYAHSLTDRISPTREQAIALNGLGWYYFGRAEHARASRLADRVYAAAEFLDDPLLRLCGCDLLGVMLPTFGEFERARVVLEEGLALCNALGESVPEALFIAHPGVMLRINLAGVLTFFNARGEAHGHIDEALALAAAIRQPMATMFAAWGAARLAIRMRDLDAVERHVDALDNVVTAHDLAHGEAPRLWIRGWLQAQRGQPREGYVQIMEAYAAQERLGRLTGRAEILGHATEALLLAGEPEAARATAQRALDLARQSGELGVAPWLEALLGRTNGSIALARS